LNNKLNFYFLALFLFTLCLASSSNVSAHTPVNHSSKYSYKVDSNYYTEHFSAYINVIGANSTTWSSDHADGTLTSDNQNGDLWRIYYHSMHSGGYLNYESSAHSSHSHTAAKSSHNETWYYDKYITKGNNKIEFLIKYELKNPSGTIVETHYCKRNRVNF
jgi:hypothetical protein